MIEAPSYAVATHSIATPVRSQFAEDYSSVRPAATGGGLSKRLLDLIGVEAMLGISKMIKISSIEKNGSAIGCRGVGPCICRRSH
jgi:hypothetical protein